jgi:hypothetical protein
MRAGLGRIASSQSIFFSRRALNWDSGAVLTGAHRSHSGGTRVSAMFSMPRLSHQGNALVALNHEQQKQARLTQSNDRRFLYAMEAEAGLTIRGQDSSC